MCEGEMRLSFLIPLSLAAEIPPHLVGSYSYVFNSDLYALQVTVNSNSTANFDFIINNDCEKNVEYPKHWSFAGMPVEFNSTSNELVFLQNTTGYESQLEDIQRTFENVGPLVTPIRVQAAQDGSSIQASVIKLNCVARRTNEPLDMEALQSEYVKIRSGTNQTNEDVIQAPIQASAKSGWVVSAVSTELVVLITAPVAAGMMDWLTYL